MARIISPQAASGVCCLLLGLALASGLGCVAEKEVRKPVYHSDSTGGGLIQEINLLAMPVALNFDRQPGPDGFLIKIYASNRKRAKPFAIETGNIEIMMYDGLPDSASERPRRTWAYTAEELRPYVIQTSIGVGYQVAPLWGEAKPTHSKIAVLVRYTPLEGPPISSAPSIIAVR
jgi:hypothetical protein